MALPAPHRSLSKEARLASFVPLPLALPGARGARVCAIGPAGLGSGLFETCGVFRYERVAVEGYPLPRILRSAWLQHGISSSSLSCFCDSDRCSLSVARRDAAICCSARSFCTHGPRRRHGSSSLNSLRQIPSEAVAPAVSQGTKNAALHFSLFRQSVPFLMR